jgi:hypothetical protein
MKYPHDDASGPTERQDGNSDIPVSTFPNARRNRPIAARTLKEFEERLGSVAWFANIGRPSPWDHGCARMSLWEDWPGPENRLSDAFCRMHVVLRDRTVGTPADPDLQALFARMRMLTLSYARTEVPYDPEEDCYHAPNQCVWDAAEVTAIIACALARDRPVPEDLVELWNWYEAGHWPSCFAREPGDGPAHGALFFPRGLLVY